MAERDIQRLKRMAESGNVESGLILELIEKCKQVASGEALDGITMAFGIRSERDHDEILAGVTEDMLGELLPTMLKMTLSGVGEHFWQGLSFHVSIQQRIDIAMFSFHRMQGTWPETVTVSEHWRDALNGAQLYNYENVAGTHAVAVRYAEQDLEKILCE